MVYDDGICFVWLYDSFFEVLFVWYCIGFVLCVCLIGIRM